MISDRALLSLGAGLRSSVLMFYANTSREDGIALARRYVFELGSVLVDMHGHKEAVRVLDGVTDAIACGLPIEDFRLPAVEQRQDVPAVPPASGGATPEAVKPPLRELIATSVHRNAAGFVVGFLTGYWAGVR